MIRPGVTPDPSSSSLFVCCSVPYQLQGQLCRDGEGFRGVEDRGCWDLVLHRLHRLRGAVAEEIRYAFSSLSDVQSRIDTHLERDCY